MKVLINTRSFSKIDLLNFFKYFSQLTLTEIIQKQLLDPIKIGLEQCMVNEEIEACDSQNNEDYDQFFVISDEGKSETPRSADLSDERVERP